MQWKQGASVFAMQVNAWPQTGQVESDSQGTEHGHCQLTWSCPFYHRVPGSFCGFSFSWYSWTQLCLWGNLEQVFNTTDHVLIFESLRTWAVPSCCPCPQVSHSVFRACIRPELLVQQASPNEALNSLQTYPPSNFHLVRPPYMTYTWFSPHFFPFPLPLIHSLLPWTSVPCHSAFL